MTEHVIDLDLPKAILECPGVLYVQWRVSASGKGFHLRWFCDKRFCRRCNLAETHFDDPRRVARDAKRQPHQRKILWDVKGGRKAGKWTVVTR